MELQLHVPNWEERYYEKELLRDPATMSYNAGYDISHPGYRKESGCIFLEEEDLYRRYQKRKEKDVFFALLQRKEDGRFVGTAEYHPDPQSGRIECGIVIEAAERHQGYGEEALYLLAAEANKNGIRNLYDSFEKDRGHVRQLFESVGFRVVEKKRWLRFGEEAEGIVMMGETERIIRKAAHC